MNNIPPAVLLARLENELETLDLALNQQLHTVMRRALNDAKDIAGQLREVI